MKLKPGDIVTYNLRPSLNYVLREIDGNLAIISTIVSENRYLKRNNSVYRPTKKEWLHGRSEVHLGDLSSQGMTWGGEI